MARTGGPGELSWAPMMSPLATLLSTWAAIYAVIGVYYGLLHARERSHVEHLAFGLLCFGFAQWSAGAAMATDAATADAAILAHRVQYAGGFVSCAFFLEFASRLTGRVHGRVLVTSYAIAGAGLLLDATGWLFEEPAGPARLEPSMTAPGAVVALAAIGTSVWAVVLIWRSRREQPDLWPLVWAAGFAIAASLGDVVRQIAGQPTLYLVEHGTLVPVLTVGVILQRRFLRADDELGARTEELRRSYTELEAMQHELVRTEQLAAVGELSAVIAHEVRNPLAIIKNAISSLRRPTLRKTDRRVLLGILEEEVDRLGRLVRDLLAYARPVTPRGQPVDLAPLVEAAVASGLRFHDDPDTIAVELSIDDVGPVEGDPDLLQHALTNLAANAAQAMPEGGTLRVRGRRAREDGADVVVVELVDDGRGMESLVQTKARDPFFTTRASGTGLGLTIVDRVMRNHGGRLELISEHDRGTTARIVLPQGGGAKEEEE